MRVEENCLNRDLEGCSSMANNEEPSRDQGREEQNLCYTLQHCLSGKVED